MYASRIQAGRDDRKGTALRRRCHDGCNPVHCSYASASCCFIFNCVFVTRQAKTRATAINSVASRKGAQGNRQTRCGPMKLENDRQKRPATHETTILSMHTH